MLVVVVVVEVVVVRKESISQMMVTKSYTEAKRSFAPLAIQQTSNEKNENVEKPRETKIFVCLDKRKLGAQLRLEISACYLMNLLY